LWPFDSLTIGKMMRISPACVDQRVRTALIQIRSRLGLP
jgi:hypothetical protein